MDPIPSVVNPLLVIYALVVAFGTIGGTVLVGGTYARLTMPRNSISWIPQGAPRWFLKGLFVLGILSIVTTVAGVMLAGGQ